MKVTTHSILKIFLQKYYHLFKNVFNIQNVLTFLDCQTSFLSSIIFAFQKFAHFPKKMYKYESNDTFHFGNQHIATLPNILIFLKCPHSVGLKLMGPHKDRKHTHTH